VKLGRLFVDEVRQRDLGACVFRIYVCVCVCVYLQIFLLTEFETGLMNFQVNDT